MHGRVKTRTTAQEDELKKKERAKKVLAYRSGMKQVFDKRTSGELDEQCLQICGQLLSANPNIYTLWNIRKECLLNLKNILDDENLKRIVDNEFDLTEVCLRNNPKSYGTWHHRLWMLENMPFTSWEKELKVCNKYLEIDERNFHVWDYRRIVVKNAKVEPKTELEYSTEKININFSNYSAWHYRSKLLPIVHPDPHNVRSIEESVHKNELAMVESAAFTDPYDQSAWFYLRWLLGRLKPSLRIRQVIADEHRVCISFNQIVDLNSIEIDCLGITEWKSVNDEPFSYVFTNLKEYLDLPPKDDLKVAVKTKKSFLDNIVLIRKRSGHAEFTEVPNFDLGFTPGVIAVLEQQLHSCLKLLEFEPDSKWAMLTAVYLMQAIDRTKYKDITLNLLDQLSDIDHQRSPYYSDLKSRFNFQYLLEARDPDSLEFIASGYNLTALYYMEMLLSVKVVNLSNNSLSDRSLLLLSSLQFCQELNLKSNKIHSLKSFPFLPSLRILCIAKNKLKTVDGLLNLVANSEKLKHIDLRDNFISDQDLKRKIEEISLTRSIHNLKIKF